MSETTISSGKSSRIHALRARRRATSALWIGLLLVGLFWAGLPPTFGQNITTSLSPQTIGAGRYAEYAISIEGAASLNQLPGPMDVPGLQFQGPRQQTSISSINGVMRQTMQLVWQIYAPQAGTYTIPSMVMVVNGQQMMTEAKTLTVKEGPGPTQSYDPKLKVQIGKTELWVGEVAPISINALFHSRTQPRNYDHPKLPRENFVVKRFQPPMQGGVVEIDGSTFNPIVFQSSISAIKEGDFELGPAEMTCLVDFPDENGGAPRSFFQQMMTRQIALKSDSVKVKVKPLPTEGRPADFAGAVGRFQISARATPIQLHVGEPISIDLTITGMGNFDLISAPLFEGTDGWKTYPAKVVQENRSGGLEAGVMGYNQVIFPRKMAHEVPPFFFSYFDPETGRYEVARTQPIPVQMQPEEKPADPRSGEAPTRDFSLIDATAPDEKLTDILTLRPGRSEWSDLTPRRPDEALFWGFQALPAGLVLAFAAMGLQRKVRASGEEKRRLLAGQPRPCDSIFRDLKRQNQPRRQFYTLARELVDSWEFHQGRPIGNAGLNGTLDRILDKQRFLSYADAGPTAVEPVPGDEQREVLAALGPLAR